MKTATCQAPELVVDGLADLKAKTLELKGKRRLLMELEALKAWETATKAINPSYQEGSVRPATPQDLEVLGHVHGPVCEIRCEACGAVRVVNKQDARQTRFCRDCKKAAGRKASQARRQAKRLAGVSREDLEAQLEALNQQLAKM